MGGNFLLIPCDEGWALCKQGEYAEIAALLPVSCPWGQLSCPDLEWKRFALQDENQKVHVCLVPGVPLDTFLASIGAEVMPEALQQAIPVLSRPGSWPPHALPNSAVLEVPSVPELSLRGLGHAPDPAETPPLALVLGDAVAYVFVQDGPSVVAIMNHIRDFEAPRGRGPHNEVWTTLDGVPVATWRQLPAVSALHFNPESETWQVPSFAMSTVCAAEVLSAAAPFVLRLCPFECLQDQLTFPVATFKALGWEVVATPQPIPTDFLFRARPEVFCVPACSLPSLCAEQLFVGALNFLQGRASSIVPVQVQLAGRLVWQGRLPGYLTFQDVVESWETCHRRMGRHAPCRPYSGHRSMPPECSLAQARFDRTCRGFVKAGGWLKVTLAPEIIGGGVKDRKYADAQAGLAQFLLERGLPLNETSCLVDKVLPAAGMGRVLQLLKLSNQDNRWASFEALCKQFSIQCPPI